MYFPFFVFCLCHLAIAAVIPEDKDAKISSYTYNNFDGKEYKYSYVTSNGINRSETGQLVNAGEDNQHIAVRGLYSYTGTDGNTMTFEYTADENGYNMHRLVAPQNSIALSKPIDEPKNKHIGLGIGGGSIGNGFLATLLG